MFEDFCPECESRTTFRFLNCELCKTEEDHLCIYICVVCGTEHE